MPRPAADIQAFAERFDLPVGVSFRRQDYFDNSHPCYAGHVGISVAPPLSDRVRDADLLLLVGTRLGEASSRSYTLIEAARADADAGPRPSRRGGAGPGLYARPLPIHAGMRAFAAAARALEPARHLAPGASRPRSRTSSTSPACSPTPTPGELQLGEVMVWLREHLPRDAIVTNGAGNYCVWVNGYYQYRGYRTQLGPTSGSMGYGTPAAIAAKLVHPDRTVVGVRGRRLLPDDRPGARDRGAVRPAGHLVRGQQRHVRHDPHAPGARLPRPGDRHRSQEPGLRGARPGLRRPWRGGRAHRRLRRRLPPRRAGRHLRAARPPGRSGGDHAAALDQRDPRRRLAPS